ncbi:uncharacterized protein LOC127262308 [Andrographis paniculata]|uniref:uncharacterized protein LOC127262308 n=1 Tax=Andrographis paniculata TaxID=175694 RepID=UPI0021E745B9|nr:uncharacterized protein LOC127262308 [Andrographis paniculata]
MATDSEAKLELFLQWLKVNGAELRGCDIKYCDSSKGFGIFSSGDSPSGILLTVPLNLAITPMSVLQDPVIGPEFRSLLAKQEEDDRLLIMIFLTVERLRKNSTWRPYLDMLPTEFGNPLWFTDDELLELKGTTLHRATELQKIKLKSLFDDKVKKVAEKLLSLDGNPECEVRFEDFLWANSIFWTRALNIPFPQSYVFPSSQPEQDSTDISLLDSSTHHISAEKLVSNETGKSLEINDSAKQVSGVELTPQGEVIWVEGLVPGIDFCNHAWKAAATWEIDESGSITGIPYSMYLLSAGSIPSGEEISISYGDKGNEELLYLYGFVVKDNPDDYLMIHYPLEALSDMPFSESKMQLLEVQKGELRCLLPRSLLKSGFFSESALSEESATNKETSHQMHNYSWSGCRKIPSYIDKLVFPEEHVTALRTISMKEDELYKVTSLLEELVGTGGERQPSEAEVRAAVWEACGDSGALQVLVDLLNLKLTELEEGSGTEESDAELLQNPHMELPGSEESNGMASPPHLMSRRKWASITYRQGQKELTRRFLMEAEHALQSALTEGN